MTSIAQPSGMLPQLKDCRLSTQVQAAPSNLAIKTNSKLSTSKLAFAVPVIGAGVAVAGVALIVAGWAITWYSNGQNQKDIAQCASQVVDYLVGVKAAAGDFLKDVVIPNKKVMEAKLTKLFKSLASTLSQAPSVETIQKMVAEEVGAMLGMNPPKTSPPQNARANEVAVVHQPPSGLKAADSIWFNLSTKQILRTTPTKHQTGQWAQLTVFVDPNEKPNTKGRVVVFLNKILKIFNRKIVIVKIANGGPPGKDPKDWNKIFKKLLNLLVGSAALVVGGSAALTSVKFGPLDIIDGWISNNDANLSGKIDLQAPGSVLSNAGNPANSGRDLIKHWKHYLAQANRILEKNDVVNSGTRASWERHGKQLTKTLAILQKRLESTSDITVQQTTLTTMLNLRLPPTMVAEYDGSGNDISGPPLQATHAAVQANKITAALKNTMNATIEQEVVEAGLVVRNFPN